MMPSKSLILFSAATLLGLILAPSFVLSVDRDELYDNPEVIDTIAESAEEDSSLYDLLGESGSAALAKDVVVVLDNSGSMKKNDPDFLATQAVSEFISGLDSQTRIAVIIFDQNVSLAVPLTYLSIETRDTVLSSLRKVNYRGLFTDSPAAIERAIYELKSNGREDAQKSIVFMTDGIVDTGKADVDLEKSKWLKEDLAADAADESIKVFAVAFTEAADFQLIQSIAQKTDGEYYRALEAADLQKVFKQINIILNEPPGPLITDTVAVPLPAAQPAPVVQQPVIIEVPVQPAQSMGKEERVRSTIMIVAAAVLFITLLAIVYLLLRRGRDMSAASDEVVTDAFINDIHNHTASSQYQLGQKPTMFGRVAGKDTEHLNYLVIPESTIGRRHALIEYKDYGFWISDQGSINGTFVNDNLINSEVCLKHGDKVRLHKFEFEFAMPEMDDAGMTVVSNTTYAAPADTAEEATVLKDSGSAVAEEDNDLEPEFDITGGVEPDFVLDMGAEDEDDDEAETIIRGDSGGAEQANETDSSVDDESEDETLIPGGGGLQEDQADDDTTGEADEENSEDETLMRGNFDTEEEEDVTIRKEVDEALEDFFDIGADNDDKNT
jgi:pSer/pThr/pTyr-binding forkhead associated (FHA) protein/Mg-chelatase subunit ChlD